MGESFLSFQLSFSKDIDNLFICLCNSYLLLSAVCIPPPVFMMVMSFLWQEGAILVFLPGWDNISGLNDLLMAQQMFRSGREGVFLNCILQSALWLKL